MRIALRSVARGLMVLWAPSGGRRGMVGARARTVVCVPAVCLTVLALLAGAGTAQAASDSASSADQRESAGVRAALAHEASNTTPLVETRGGSGAESTPAGELDPSLSTAYSNTWRAPGKPLATRIYPAPVNYKATDGRWHAISNELVPSALGGYENKANSFKLTVPTSLSNGMRLSNGGATVTFALQGGKEAMPAVTGASARYREALPATDFEYDATSTGVKETAILTGTSAPSAISFSVAASSGLSLHGGPDGELLILNEQGSTQFSVPAPVAYRSGEDPGAGRRLPLSFAASGSGWTLSVDTSAAWLRHELTEGPVAIDPTVNAGGSQNCWVESDSPKSSYCSQTGFDVGYQSTEPAHEHHGLLEFNLSSLPQAANIFNAKLGLYLQSHSTSTSKPVGVYRVTKPWTTSATWETYDGTHAWSTPGGDYSSGEDGVVNSSVGTATGWSYWYPTKMVQEWVNTAKAPEQTGRTEGAENYGLIVKDQTDNSVNNVLTFSSIRASEHQPYLEVFYEPEGYGNEPQYTTISTPLSDRSDLNVNVGSGNLQITSTDLQLSGVAGLGFSSAHIWNSLNPEEQEYTYWTDSNAIDADPWPDGSVSVNDGTGAHYTFLKKPEGSFITPPGIKASLCAVGSPAPCPTLPSGVAYRLTYDQSQFHYDYNSEGARLDQQDQYGNTIGHEWLSSTHQIFTDTHGHKIEEFSNSETWLTEIKDVSGGRSSKYGYETTEGHKELTSYTDANAKVTKYGYSGTKLASITDPLGNVIKFEYDSKHRVTKIIRTTNSEHTTGPTTRFVYYEAGEAPSPCTSNQKATIVRDPDWKESKPTEHETTYCANVLDEVEQTVDAEGHATTAKYDGLGNSTLTTAAAPGESGSGNKISSVYDSTGRNLMCQLNGAELTTSCPSSTERPDEHGLLTSYEYNGKGTPFSATLTENPQNKTIQGCYGGEEQEVKGSEAKCEGLTSPSGSLQTQIDQLPSEKELKFEYNSNGTIKASKDAKGNTTTYAYDEHGNLKEVVPPSPLHATKITVDADGRPETITDGAGHKATITYDKLDRVTKIVYAGTGTERTVKYEYDADGNVLKREDPTGTTKYKADALNRLTKEELPGSLSNEYGYDEASNVIAFTDAGGTTKYGYNKLNELESLTEPSASNSTTFTYDNDHRLTSIAYPSGAKQSYTLNATGQPEKISYEGLKEGASVPNLTYTYKSGTDPTALVQQVTDAAGGETTYSYNALDQLTKAVTVHGSGPSFYKFALDGDGNRTEQKVNPTKGEEAGAETTYYVYNAANELECRQTVAPAPGCSGSASTELSHYTYDEAGDQLTITPKADTNGTTFAFNAASELSKLTPSGGSEQSLSYLGTGQDALTGVGSTTLQNGGLGLTKETTSSGTSYYARTPEGLLIDERTPSGSYNPLYDAQGDVIALVNASTGKVERNFRYGPYGENVKSEGTQTIPYPFGYKGGYRMPGGNAGKGNVSNGLLHFGQRYYDPTTGRWTQQDPLSQYASPTAANRFLFTGADPINMSDPTGLDEEELEEGLENAGEGCAYGAAYGAYAGAAGPEGAVAGAAGGCVGGAAISVVKEGVEEIEEAL
jgi:RHS repeat-associated protein